MKKSFLAISITLALFSCKKKEVTNDFVPTDVSGVSIVKGNINKNVIIPNGAGGWTNNGTVNVADVIVSVTVNRGGANGLYPNSLAQGADVYTGKTDANGNYSIAVKSNATGVQAKITVNGFTGTQDTIINNVVKTGLYATYIGASINRTLIMGQNTTYDYNFLATNVSSNPNIINIGTAQLSGTVGINYFLTVKTGTFAPFFAGEINQAAPAGTKVYMSFENDPTLLTSKLYTTTTDAAGRYSFSIATVAAGTPGFNLQRATIWVADYAATKDTVREVNGIISPNRTTGASGVFNSNVTSEDLLFSNENRNAADFSFGQFVPN